MLACKNYCLIKSFDEIIFRQNDVINVFFSNNNSSKVKLLANRKFFT